MERDDYLEAAKLLEISAQASPHFKTLELLGECWLKNGDPHGAILPLAASIGFDRNVSRACYLLGRAFAELGDKDEAILHLKRALAKQPDFKQARILLEVLSHEP